MALSARALDYDGQPCLVLGVLDLTEKQAAEVEIERQREIIYQREKLGALGSLLAGVAHELNNPLSVVVAQATLLAGAGHRSARPRRAARRSGCGRALRPDRQDLPRHGAAAPPSRCRGRPQPGRRRRRSSCSATASAPPASRFAPSLAPNLPTIWADPDQISQVLTNLIVNAQQAMAEWSGPRRLTDRHPLRSARRQIRLSVADSGPGVPPAIRSRIFEPFFTTKPVGIGTGIGLSVCHGVVTAHGGTITVDDAPGGGAVFVIRLPATTTVEAAAPAGPAPSLIGAGGRVLVVDDEPAVAEALSDILRHAGYRIDIAESGEAALGRVRTGVYDVIFSDVHMPDMDGLTFYRNLRELKPELADRLMFVTGDMLGGNIRTFIEETGLPFLEKPFMPAEVRRLAAETAARPARPTDEPAAS